MTTLRQKFILVFLGPVVLLLLLEFILRISGFVYRSYRIKNEAQSVVADDGTVRILCLGDSFTFGAGAPRGYSYPEQLEKMLNENSYDSKFIVYNGAIPGGNSSQLLKRIDGLLQRFNPHVAVIMIGCNNERNPRESNYFLFSSEKGFKLYLYRLDFLLSNLRGYNLLKSIIGRLETNAGFANKEYVEADILKDRGIVESDIGRMKTKAGFANKEYAEADILKDRGIVESEEFDKLIQSGSKYFENREANLAQEAFQRAITLNPNDERGHLGLALVYIHCKHGRDQTERGIGELNKVLKINPNNVTALANLWEPYYLLGRNEQALKVIEKYLRLHPEDEQNLSHSLNRGLPNLNDKEAFKKLFRYDVGNTIRKIKAKKVKVILQGYGMPSPYNKVLEELAEEFLVPFIDNESVFTELIFKDGFSWKGKRDQNYFAEDGHQNANGYLVIAENVYKALRSELNF